MTGKEDDISMNNQGEEKVDWKESFIHKFREKNEAPSSFHDIIKSHLNISKQNRVLKFQKKSVENQLMILQHEHTGSAVDKVVSQLEEKIGTLQDEIVSLEKENLELGDLRF